MGRQIISVIKSPTEVKSRKDIEEWLKWSMDLMKLRRIGRITTLASPIGLIGIF